MTLNRGWTYRQQVGPEGAGLTVLEFLAATRLHTTSEEWARRLDRGEVEIEGKRATSRCILQPGQIIVWHRPPWDETVVPTNYRIVYEDESIVGVDKPCGLPTMPAGGFLNHTLLALMREEYPEASPLHRLGRHTSGLVLFARTRAAASALARAWRDHAVKKSYRALALGETRMEMYVIDVPIGPVPHPLLGTVHAAYDRAALVALPPDLRARYATQFAELMPPGSKSLLIGFEYDDTLKPGPPFSVDREEVERLYGPAFEIRELERIDIIASSPKFSAAGVTELYETVYELTRR